MILALLASLFALVQPFEPAVPVSHLASTLSLERSGEVTAIYTFTFEAPRQRFSFAFEEGLTLRGIRVREPAGGLVRRFRHRGREEIEVSLPLKSELVSLEFRAARVTKRAERIALFRFPLLAASGIEIAQASFHVSLPVRLSRPPATQLFTFRGVSEATSSASEEGVTIFAREIAPSGSVILQFPLPSEVIRPPASALIRDWLIGAPNLIFALSLALPGLAALFLLALLVRKSLEERIEAPLPLAAPPAPVSPALVGLLFSGAVTSRELGATILDLASRGFLFIVQRGDEYTFGKRREPKLGELAPFEEFLFSKIFTEKGVRKIRRTGTELRRRAAEQLYSPKISEFVNSLAQAGRHLGWFAENPALVIWRVRGIAIALFFAALLFAFFAAPQNPPLIWPALSTMVLALATIAIAPHLPQLTRLGREMRARFAAFRRFLVDPAPLPVLPRQTALFERYLPYAFALGVEGEWATRFGREVFLLPAWYETEKPLTRERFIRNLGWIVGELAKSLFALRRPELS